MPSISNVKLEVVNGTGGSRRKVTISYRLCFTHCEVLAGSVFIEKAELRGEDWWLNPDDNLITLRKNCVKASKDCIDRKITANVSRSTLDEDGDTVIFGIPIDADRDELYARVSLTPFITSSKSADSNMVYGQFGAAGND